MEAPVILWMDHARVVKDLLEKHVNKNVQKDSMDLNAHSSVNVKMEEHVTT